MSGSSIRTGNSKGFMAIAHWALAIWQPGETVLVLDPPVLASKYVSVQSMLQFFLEQSMLQVLSDVM